MAAMLSALTDEDFSRALNKAFINGIQHFLNPKETEMISLGDMKKLLKPQNEVYKGMQIVPVRLIVGSEGRYQDFDNHFFPKSKHLKTRWEHIDMAHHNGTPLPPISLYELGGLYFVRDGNHRVSVAKAQGVENIDAEVVSLQSEIRLKPKYSLSKMTRQVIQYEKRMFYFETGFGDITDYWCLDFSTPGQYDVIYNHILIHKYYINMDKDYEISMEDAIVSWFQNVYMPIIIEIDNRHLMGRFPRRTKSDLYVWMVKYWDDLKLKFGNDYSLDKAAQEFDRRFCRHPADRFVRRLRRRIKNALSKLLCKSALGKDNANKGNKQQDKT